MLPASILFDLPQTPIGMLQLLVLSGAIAGLTGMGATALVKSVSLSAMFVRHGTAELREHRQAFWRGLAWAVLPLVATNILLPGLTTEMIDERASGIFSYGLTLSVPLLHLWAELRYRD
jgi:NADH:ubiquinone oxidoreductase subunit 6 (subunit J)